MRFILKHKIAGTARTTIPFRDYAETLERHIEIPGWDVSVAVSSIDSSEIPPTLALAITAHQTDYEDVQSGVIGEVLLGEIEGLTPDWRYQHPSVPISLVFASLTEVHDGDIEAPPMECIT